MTCLTIIKNDYSYPNPFDLGDDSDDDFGDDFSNDFEDELDFDRLF